MSSAGKPERTYRLSSDGGRPQPPNHARVAAALSDEELRHELANLPNLWPDEPEQRDEFRRALLDEIERRS